MAGNDQAASIKACALRVTRLAPDGTTPAGANNMIVTDDVMNVDAKIVKEEGEDITIKNACGTVQYTQRDDDQVKRIDLGVTFTNPDVEITELTLGGSLITSAGMSIGWAMQAVGGVNNDGVCLELWSKAILGGSVPAPSVFYDFATTNGSTTITSNSANFSLADVGRTVTGSGVPTTATILAVTSPTSATISVAATATQTGQTLTIGRPGRFWRHVFPMFRGTIDDFSFANEAKEHKITGTTYENIAIGNGPNNDFPSSAPIGRVYSYFRDTALPVIGTGYQPTPAQV